MAPCNTDSSGSVVPIHDAIEIAVQTQQMCFCCMYSGFNTKLESLYICLFHKNVSSSIIVSVCSGFML